MADATWSVEWGDATWGEGEASESLGIVDLAGNPMATPSQVSCLGFFDSETPFSSNRIYDAHIQSIRDDDFTNGGLFWKRFCEGPEQLRIQQKNRVLSLMGLANANTVPDEHLMLIALTYGWDYECRTEILEKIEPSKLRSVLSQSHDIWERRGLRGSVIEAMNILVGVRAFETDWFDKKWNLGQTSISGDALFLAKSSRREFQILIVDPTRQLDKDVLVNITKKWRPSGERVTLTWAEFVDYFDDTSQGWQAQSGSFSISGGLLTIPSLAASRVMLPDVRNTLSDVMIKAKVQFTGNSEFGILARSNIALSGIEARVSALGTARIISDGIQVGSADLESFGIFLNPGYDVDIKLHAKGTTFELFVNGQSVLEVSEPAAQTTGLCGFLTESGVALEAQSFEVLPLPGENIYVGLNGQTRTFPV